MAVANGLRTKRQPTAAAYRSTAFRLFEIRPRTPTSRNQSADCRDLGPSMPCSWPICPPTPSAA